MLLFAITLTACSSDDDDDDDPTAGDGAGATAATTDSGDAGDATDPATSEGPSETGIVDTGTTGHAGGASCDAAPEDDACTACAKANCCEAYAACYGDADCVCAVDCIVETGDYATCLGPMCNGPDPAPAMDIGICYGTTCAADCGFGA
jgi:hypothetical protein